MLLKFSPFKHQISSFVILYKFSNLKNRFIELKSQQFKNHKQFYQNIRKFQDDLQYDEWIKFKKLIYQVDKKNRKFQTINKQNESQNKQQSQTVYELDGSITSQYFYQKHTQFKYYKQQIPSHKIGETKPQILTLSLNQLKQLVSLYLQQEITPYLTKIIPLGSQTLSFMNSITRRYQAIEQNLCRHIFKGYTQFSQFQQNLFFKTQQKYKGDFKFRIKDDNQLRNQDSQFNQNSLIQTFSQIAKKIASINQCRPKIQLAIQMILNQNWNNLQPNILANLLFCTALNGKDVKIINMNFDEIAKKILNSQKKQNAFLSLLIYMCISKIQNQQIYKEIQNIFNTSYSVNLNLFEKVLLRTTLIYLSQAKQMDILINQKLKNTLYKQQCQQLIDKSQQNSQVLRQFSHFLQQKGYQYTIIPSTDRSNVIAPYQIVQIDNKKFICYSSLYYQPNNQSHLINGLSKLVNDYFFINGQKVKIINGKTLMELEKWTEKQNYLKSKMKGITKIDIKKQIKFDFYSPREQFFRNKQQKGK